MNKGRVYCSADWHGCWHVAKKVLDYLGPDDTLYFLGDAIDRGSSGLKIFDELIADPRIIFLKGNHEAMMADAIPFLAKEIADINYYGGNGYNLWFQNGGNITAKPFWDMSQERIYKYKELVDKMPTEVRYASPAGHTVIMEHAGYTPFSIPRRSHDPLWDREHFYDNWIEYPDTHNLDPDKTYLVHGHTPIQYLKYMYGYNGEQPLTEEEMKQKQEWLHSHRMEFDWKPTILRYCDGHKFDIDMCTIVSNRIALLNLDTFEEIYFDGEED